MITTYGNFDLLDPCAIDRIVPHGIRELPHKPHQVGDVVLVPGRKYRAPDPVQRGVYDMAHSLALRGNDGRPHAAVGNGRLAPDQPGALKLCHLPGDGRVIAPHSMSQFHDTDGAATFDRTSNGTMHGPGGRQPP